MALSLIGMFSVTAQGASSPAGSPGTGSLTTQLVRLGQDVARLRAASNPGQALSQPFLYLRAPVEDVRVARVEVFRGAERIRRYAYTGVEADVLRAGGIHRLVRMSAADSPSRLRVMVVLQDAKDASRAGRSRIHLDQPVRVDAATPGFVLNVADRGWMRGAEMQLRPATADMADESLRFLIDSGHHDRALSRLVAIPAGAGQSSALIQQAIKTLAAGPVADSAEDMPAELAQARMLMQAGQAAQARALLRDLATAQTRSIAVRDQASLLLGYSLLAAGQGADAAPIFRQVSSLSPFANRAILGLGWSHLVASGVVDPVDQPQTGMIATADRIARMRRVTPFRYAHAVATGERADDIKRALVPWAELVGRDPMDPAIQEGMLVLPYAFTHLGAMAQAQRYLQRAITRLERLLVQIDGARAQVREGLMAERLLSVGEAVDSGWPAWFAALPEPRWWLTRPPEAPANFYLDYLVRNTEFRAALDRAWRVTWLQQMAQNQVQILAGSGVDTQQARALEQRLMQLQTALDARADAGRQVLKTLGLQALSRARSSTQRYLAEAYFAMARLHDRPLPVAVAAEPQT